MTDQLDIFAKAPRWRPEGFDITKLTPIEGATLWFLRFHVGRARAIVEERLAAALHTTDRKLRAVLKHMSETHDIGICSTSTRPYGVYLVETLEEEEDYLKRETGRALSILRRVARHKRSHVAALAGQIVMQLENSSTSKVQGSTGAEG